MGSPAVGVAAGRPAPQATAGGPALPAPLVPFSCQDGRLPRRRTKEGRDPRPPQSGGSTKAKPSAWRRPWTGQKRKKPALPRPRQVLRQGAAELSLRTQLEKRLKRRWHNLLQLNPRRGRSFVRGGPRVVLRSVPAERRIRLKSVQRSAVTLKSGDFVPPKGWVGRSLQLLRQQA